jgi:hypothetical protein
VAGRYDAGTPLPRSTARRSPSDSCAAQVECAGAAVRRRRWPDDLLSCAIRCATLHRFSAGGTPRAGPRTHREASLSLALGDDNTLISPVTLFEMPDHVRPPKISISASRSCGSIRRRSRHDPAALTTRTSTATIRSGLRVVVVKKDDPTACVGIRARHRRR